MHKEGYYKNIEIDNIKLKKYLSQKICSDKALVLVLKADNLIVGFFVAEIVEYFFSKELLAIDSLFFIVKEKRKSTGAMKILKSYFQWAESHNVKEITLSSTNGVEVEKIEKMYAKLGFRKVGVMYKKGV
ncbi:hypothetical protein [Sulfurimonas sp.]